jgi:hypothetical protein
MFSQGERRFHGTEYSCNCSARSNKLHCINEVFATNVIDFPGNGPLEHVGISEYIGYVGCYDLDNNGSLETK